MTTLKTLVRRLVADPARYEDGMIEGRVLDEHERGALEAELQVLMQLSLATTLPGDAEREAVIRAYEAVSGVSSTSTRILRKVVIPVGR